MQIRNFNIAEDYDEVIGLWELCELSYKPEGRDSREKMEEELERGCAIFLLAEDAGRTIGTVLGTHDGRKGWINRLAVHPDFRQRGIGRELVNYVEQALYNEGIDIIACLIEGDNADSFNAFSRMGYIDFPGMLYLTKRRYPEV